jgi:hypothetical protein
MFFGENVLEVKERLQNVGFGVGATQTEEARGCPAVVPGVEERPVMATAIRTERYGERVGPAAGCGWGLGRLDACEEMATGSGRDRNGELAAVAVDPGVKKGHGARSCKMFLARETLRTRRTPCPWSIVA